jgi:hypothetical protein
LRLTPTPITAALAGIFSGAVMPFVWSRFGNDSMAVVPAFLVVVAVPAHAFVVGFSHAQPADGRKLDTALLKRVGAWLAAAVIVLGIGHFVRG